MKKAKLFMLAFAALAFAACTNEKEDGGTPEPGNNAETAFLSLAVTYPTSGTRASDEENATPEESAIDQLYVLTFDASQTIVRHKDEVTNWYQVLSSSSGSALVPGSGKTELSKPIKISAATKYLLVIANPGTQMLAKLNALGAASTYNTFNSTIAVPAPGSPADATKDYLTLEVMQNNAGTLENFTMINAGILDDSDLNPDNWAWDPSGLLDVSGNIVPISAQYPDETAASNAAKAKKAELKIERLAAKMEVTVKSGLIVLPLAANGTDPLAQFDFVDAAGPNPGSAFWTIDQRNSLFYPFAVKTRTISSHDNPSFYKANFYTQDPNFGPNATSPYLTGIVKNELKADRSPDVVWRGVTTALGNIDYAIENTMDDEDQKFGAATRLILKGLYAPFAVGAPDNFVLGSDWFYLGTTDKAYASFDLLKAAYLLLVESPGTGSEVESTSSTNPLVKACMTFVEKLNAEGYTTATKFSALTAADLLTVPAGTGGQLTAINNSIRWYQGSLNYYYYEIRHDNGANGIMAYGKYGIVRNNWYALELQKVNGRGTPWYPGTSPEDPDPETPIDEETAFLDFEIKVGPWVYWTTGFEI